MMYEPKKDIYTILGGLGIQVYQQRPETIPVFPSITFYISGNRPIIDLNKEISYQAIEVVIDIWANTSSESGQLLTTLEDTMRANDYQMMFSADMIDPSGISHITTRFNLLY